MPAAHGCAWRRGPRAAECGTPLQLEVLAAAPLSPRWQELPHRERHTAWEGLHTATMCLHRKGKGWVFTVGTTDWAQVLANGGDPVVPVVTRNVIRGLAHAP